MDAPSSTPAFLVALTTMPFVNTYELVPSPLVMVDSALERVTLAIVKRERCFVPCVTFALPDSCPSSLSVRRVDCLRGADRAGRAVRELDLAALAGSRIAARLDLGVQAP